MTALTIDSMQGIYYTNVFVATPSRAHGDIAKVLLGWRDRLVQR